MEAFHFVFASKIMSHGVGFLIILIRVECTLFVILRFVWSVFYTV